MANWLPCSVITPKLRKCEHSEAKQLMTSVLHKFEMLSIFQKQHGDFDEMIYNSQVNFSMTLDQKRNL